MRIFNSVVV